MRRFLVKYLKKVFMSKEVDLQQGDCLELLKQIPDNSVDSIVTDPPYGLSFMGKKWDYDVPSEEIWRECLRVLKPGGHLLAFAGTRTQHRMAVRIEDAGFEIRDMIAWVYGSGFPKSLDVSKAIDKAAGVERDVLGEKLRKRGDMTGGNLKKTSRLDSVEKITAPATQAAKQWQGWGTALKPALEPITVARKPLIRTVAENVLTHGTGALNIDGCRVVTDDDLKGGRHSENSIGNDGNSYGRGINKRSANEYAQPAGRWPANLIHDGGEYFGEQSRFFYCAKASKKDRDEGLEEFEVKSAGAMDGNSGRSGTRTAGDGVTKIDQPCRANIHPTVKPTDLMRYLCRLVTPPNGTVLDPFMGSGSTGKAARLEGFRFIGMELDEEYFEIARSRIDAAKALSIPQLEMTI
jgi:DNA modification methylase